MAAKARCDRLERKNRGGHRDRIPAPPLSGGRTLAGLDLGEKTIGVAVSDRACPSRIRVR